MMKAIKTLWVNRLAALGLVVGLTAGFSATSVAQSVAGQAFGTYVHTPVAASGQSPLAVLPAISGTEFPKSCIAWTISIPCSDTWSKFGGGSGWHAVSNCP